MEEKLYLLARGLLVVVRHILSGDRADDLKTLEGELSRAVRPTSSSDGRP